MTHPVHGACSASITISETADVLALYQITVETVGVPAIRETYLDRHRAEDRLHALKKFFERGGWCEVVGG